MKFPIFKNSVFKNEESVSNFDQNCQKRIIAGLCPATPLCGAGPLPTTQMGVEVLTAVLLDTQEPPHSHKYIYTYKYI